jgi:hypothetical protein
MSLPSTTRLPANHCPACGKLLNAATHPTEDIPPKAGDLTMCICCGEFFCFCAGLELRPLDGGVLAEADLIEIQRLRRAWAAMRANRSGIGDQP